MLPTAELAAARDAAEAAHAAREEAEQKAAQVEERLRASEAALAEERTALLLLQQNAQNKSSAPLSTEPAPGELQPEPESKAAAVVPQQQWVASQAMARELEGLQKELWRAKEAARLEEAARKSIEAGRLSAHEELAQLREEATSRKEVSARELAHALEEHRQAQLALEARLERERRAKDEAERRAFHAEEELRLTRSAGVGRRTADEQVVTLAAEERREREVMELSAALRRRDDVAARLAAERDEALVAAEQARERLRATTQRLEKEVSEASTRARAEVEAAEAARIAEVERADERIRLASLVTDERIEQLKAKMESGAWDAEAVNQLRAAGATGRASGGGSSAGGEAGSAAGIAGGAYHDILKKYAPAPRGGPSAHSLHAGGRKRAPPSVGATAAKGESACHTGANPAAPTGTRVSGLPVEGSDAFSGHVRVHAPRISPEASARLRALADREPEELWGKKEPPKPKSREILDLEAEWEDGDVAVVPAGSGGKARARNGAGTSDEGEEEAGNEALETARPPVSISKASQGKGRVRSGGTPIAFDESDWS